MNPALVPVLAALGTSVVNYVGDSFRARKERRLAKQNWYEMAEYNSPARQLQRYKAAGISPAYGGGFTSGNVGMIPDAATTVSTYHAPDVSGELTKYQAFRNAAAENQRIKKSTESLEIENRLKELERKFNEETFDIRSNQLSKNLWNTQYKTDLDRIRVARETDLDMRKLNPELLKYQQTLQNYEQSKTLFDLEKQLKRIELDMNQGGISKSDNVFLRIMYQMFMNNSPLTKKWKNMN